MLANILIVIGLILIVIGYLFWKKIYIEIKGEDYGKILEREKNLEVLGENLVYFALGILVLSCLYKFLSILNTKITFGGIILFGLVFAVRYNFQIQK
ncbi:hypothetical protein [Anaerobranca gottschalkii]|uniref:DUF3784 domain-containing protein n=1 Tax=Anaerobranca gottschalkii DSM 13577 TaxID=1120990 RepID=A0A1I0B750_9FIRM|nr:hypothetical protein [Anaerobranca gottschalkii]SET02568.1 hypothetical protein SAMN03080614_10338 [Anaerobranca gottschalkii DSM 13577]